MLDLNEVQIHLVKNAITYIDICKEIERREFLSKETDDRLSKYSKSELHEIAYATNIHAFNK
jgi:hypothetical protein